MQQRGGVIHQCCLQHRQAELEESKAFDALYAGPAPEHETGQPKVSSACLGVAVCQQLQTVWPASTAHAPPLCCHGKQKNGLSWDALHSLHIYMHMPSCSIIRPTLATPSVCKFLAGWAVGRLAVGLDLPWAM
jgi:hypothetical protein